MAIRFTFAGLFERFKSRKLAAPVQPNSATRGKGLMSPRRALGEKYSEEAYTQVRSIYKRSKHVASADRGMLKDRVRNIYDLANHPKLNRDNLPNALMAANVTTLGTVKAILDHPKVLPDSVTAAMKVINTTEVVTGRDSGYRNVLGVLGHPKTKPGNARVFLEALDQYGYNHTMRFMDMGDVNERNIKERLETFKRMGNTQQIKLE